MFRKRELVLQLKGKPNFVSYFCMLFRWLYWNGAKKRFNGCNIWSLTPIWSLFSVTNIKVFGQTLVFAFYLHLLFMALFLFQGNPSGSRSGRNRNVTTKKVIELPSMQQQPDVSNTFNSVLVYSPSEST